MKKLILLLLFIPLVCISQIKNGKVNKYHWSSWSLESSTNYVDGKRQGEYKEYYKAADSLPYIYEYEDVETSVFIKNGDTIDFFMFKVGQISLEANFVDGKLNGESKTYYKTGELYSSTNYVDGKRQGEYKEYHKAADSLPYNYEYEDVETSVFIKNGDTIDFFMFKVGQISLEANFVDGKLNGESKTYYKTGELYAIKFVKDDKLHGESKTYYKTGELKSLEYWVNNSLKNFKEYSKSGELIPPPEHSDDFFK